MTLLVSLADVRDRVNSASKIRGAEMSYELMMQRFVASLHTHNEELIWDSNKHPCLWNGVDCEEHTIVRIRWNWCKLHGNLSLSFLPSTVRELLLYKNLLEGSLEVAYLPEKLEHISVGENNLSGGISLTSLPNALERADFTANAFEGALELSTLPSKLSFLWLSKNKFEGTINLTSLPSSLLVLDLRGNQLTGNPSLDNLPSLMLHLYLSDNRFEGELDCRALSARLALHVERNMFSKIILPPVGQGAAVGHTVPCFIRK